MRRCVRIGWLAAVLALALPAAAGAETAGEDAPEPAAADAKSAASEAPAAAPARPEEELEGVTAIVQRLQGDGILVRVAGTATDPEVQPVFLIAPGRGVVVSGNNKNGWLDLRRGDLVLVSYVKGDPPVARKVNVLPRAHDPLLLAAQGIDPVKPRERSFIGYVKRKQGDELHVLAPAPVNQPRRRPEIKEFVRHEDTRVEVLRDSWDDLRKGDRVKIAFQKGNPRPADLVQVIWLGGEKPLPPGVPTRIYHPSYDASVEDVDGIGETGPVPPPVPPRKLPVRRIKLPRQ